MKKIVLLTILLIISFDTWSQSYDSLYFHLRDKKINFRDKLGRKQGSWMHYKIKLCENDSSLLKLEPNNILISEISKGEYLNDKKIGTWEYYTDNHNPCYDGEQLVTKCLYKTEIHINDIVIIYGRKPCYARKRYQIITDHDTSFIVAKVFKTDSTFCASCIKALPSDKIVCKVFGGIDSIFIRKELIFENLNDIINLLECGCLCW